MGSKMGGDVWQKLLPPDPFPYALEMPPSSSPSPSNSFHCPPPLPSYFCGHKCPIKQGRPYKYTQDTSVLFYGEDFNQGSFFCLPSEEFQPRHSVATSFTASVNETWEFPQSQQARHLFRICKEAERCTAGQASFREDLTRLRLWEFLLASSKSPGRLQCIQSVSE